jgi:hypothetical protein
LITSEGFSESWPFQVANVNTPLGSVADRFDNKCRVVYDQDDDGKDHHLYIGQTFRHNYEDEEDREGLDIGCGRRQRP